MYLGGPLAMVLLHQDTPGQAEQNMTVHTRIAGWTVDDGRWTAFCGPVRHSEW